MAGTASASDTRTAEELAKRLLQSTLGAFDIFGVYIGDRLGLYRTLVEKGPATPPELATRAGIDERYAREWLEQQAVTGILDVRDGTADANQRRFSLRSAYAETLLNVESLNFMSPIARMSVAVAQQLPALMEAFRTGGGVAWAAYGPDMWQGQAAINRPLFANLLGRQYLPLIPDVHQRLNKPGVRVADIACGAGWSSIAIAQAYASAQVDGFDLDADAIEQGGRNATQAGVADRVHFSARDITADPAIRGRYDLVTIFEALHDVPRPVQLLAAMQGMLTQGGSVLVMDERVADRFTAPGDDVERIMYGWSVLTCLPGAMTEKPSAATGTVMRSDTLRRYADEAGFRITEVLPIENDFFRFYRLRP